MEALKLKATTANGKLTIAVPDEFNNKEVEIIVLSTEKEEDEKQDTDKKEKEEKVKRLLSVINTAKNPDAPLDKYDEYEQ